MSMPDVICLEKVSKTFRLHQDTSFKDRILRPAGARSTEFQALKDVSLSIPVGSSVGLMGHNGSGKSTLLKIMGAIIRPTSGRVTSRGRMAALLELGAGFHQDLTGRENIYLNASILGMTKRETDACLDQIIEFSGIEQFIDSQVKFYSSGMYVRLAFAVAVHSDPDILLVDEVLAVGDEPFQRKCMDKIRQFQSEGRSIILVSHSAEQVGSVCDRAVVLNRGQMVFDGETHQAIHVLRQGFEYAAQAQSGQESARAGATISDVRVVDGAGNEVWEINTGDDALIEFTVTAQGLDEGWIAAFSIETNLGQVLFRFDTKAAQMSLPRIEGVATVAFELPTLPLGDGAYRLNVGIADCHGRTLDRRAEAWNLLVKGPYVGTGPLGIEPGIRVS